MSPPVSPYCTALSRAQSDALYELGLHTMQLSMTSMSLTLANNQGSLRNTLLRFERNYKELEEKIATVRALVQEKEAP